jgi:hypothetical protein
MGISTTAVANPGDDEDDLDERAPHVSAQASPSPKRTAAVPAS